MSWVVKTLSKSKITINFSSQNTGTSFDWAISDGRDDVTVTVVTFNFRKWNVVSAATSVPPMKSTRINCISRSKSLRCRKNIGPNTPPDLATLAQFCCLLIEPKKHLQKKNTLTCLRWVLQMCWPAWQAPGKMICWRIRRATWPFTPLEVWWMESQQNRHFFNRKVTLGPNH